ncbi:MAG: low molecular weight protein-tyrosine-phosphatase [Bacteroidota bacterium]
MTMTSILMVCLGNICRSPLAHGIMEHKLNPNNYYVDSAGTADYHVSAAPDRRSIKVAKENGIDISSQRGRQFQVSDFDKFDHIFVMDNSNLNNVAKLARNASDMQKVKLILDTQKETTAEIVPDPYYGDFSDFEKVFKILDKACNYWIERL